MGAGLLCMCPMRAQVSLRAVPVISGACHFLVCVRVSVCPVLASELKRPWSLIPRYCTADGASIFDTENTASVCQKTNNRIPRGPPAACHKSSACGPPIPSVPPP